MTDLFRRDFDDLAEGAQIETRGRTITETDLVSFSALTGDWHPQHSDAAWAAESVFGERIAHGMLVLSYVVGLLPIDPERVVALRGIDNVVFKRAARIGDTIHVAGRIASLRPLDEQTGLVELAAQVRGAEDELLVRLTLKVIWRRAHDRAVIGEGDGSEEEAEADPVHHGRVLV